MWGERVPADRRGGVILACAATGAIGMIFAPALDQNSPWINYEALTRGFTPARVDRFNWSQTYGPLVWPRSGTDVLSVSASPPAFAHEYWKTENLDSFNGTAWFTGGESSGTVPIGVSAQTRRQFTQSLTVTIGAMSTNQVIAAGYADAPEHLSTQPQPGESLGTWISPTALGPGDTYTVQVYVPHPSDAQLARAGDGYPNDVRGSDLSLGMPQLHVPADLAPQVVLFAPFGAHRAGPQNQTGELAGVEAIDNSPYRQAYSVAQRLVRGAHTPYQFVNRVLSYLSVANGFSYNQNPPVSRYPLASFLVDKTGYCQQFAGALAMLLRMGGVPARVATGFTTGLYDSATKRWVVTDTDAHAWVEAWFPHYGWVTFDATPLAAPARANQAIGGVGSLGAASAALHPTRHAEEPVGSSTGATQIHAGSSDTTPVLLGALGAVVALLVLGLVAWSRTGGLDADGLLVELERALRRSGRAISDEVTLAALEHRFSTSPDAAAYIRALRLSRFSGEGDLPSLRQRRALRAQLRAGLGFAGVLRALWALPPRPKRSRRRGRKRSGAVLN
jgi:transglutaminase-like putative cysteine protease